MKTLKEHNVARLEEEYKRQLAVYGVAKDILEDLIYRLVCNHFGVLLEVGGKYELAVGDGEIKEIVFKELISCLEPDEWRASKIICYYENALDIEIVVDIDSIKLLEV